MEKQRAKHLTAKFCGLLMCASAFCARQIKEQSRRTYQFAYSQDSISAGGEVLTDKECVFTVTADEVPARVSAQMPVWPNGVRFVSSTLLPKDTAAENIGEDSRAGDRAGGRIKGKIATELTIALVITKAGEYTLPPVTLFIKGKERQAAFPQLHVLQNPDTAIPSLTLVIEDMEGKGKAYIQFSQAGATQSPSPVFTVPVGQKVRLTIVPRYARIDNARYSIPDGAILQREGDNAPASFSPLAPPSSTASTASTAVAASPRTARAVLPADAAPVAFLWQPLEAGEVFLPVIVCDITALNGKSTALSTPPAIVNVTAPRKEEADTAATEGEAGAILFPYAFDTKHEAGYGNLTPSLTEGSKPNPSGSEMAAADSTIAAKGRSILPLSFCIAIAVASAVFCVLCIKHRRGKIALCIFAASLSAGASLAIFFAVVLLSPHGVFVGNAIRSIPDEHSAVIPLATGTAVRILEKTPSYLYVQSGAIKGWAAAEDVIIR